MCQCEVSTSSTQGGLRRYSFARVQPHTWCIWAGVVGLLGKGAPACAPTRGQQVLLCKNCRGMAQGADNASQISGCSQQSCVTVAQAHSSGAAAAARWRRVASSVGKTHCMGVHSWCSSRCCSSPPPWSLQGWSWQSAVTAPAPVAALAAASSACPCRANIAHVHSRVCLCRQGWGACWPVWCNTSLCT